jgi:transposase
LFTVIAAAARPADTAEERKENGEGSAMEVLYPRCCGLDVHKKTVVACVLITEAGKAIRKEVRTFPTMSADQLGLADWLRECGCTHVAMESTGVSWRPIYNLLEDDFTLLVVNAQHSKAVPGRKTDVADSEWIADLLRHGLLRASFIPPRPQRELRDLTRYRTSLRYERVAEVNRLQKILEGANIKLASVVSDITGKSGHAILLALVAGTTDAAALAQLAYGTLRGKMPQLERALAGQFSAHQRFLVAHQLAHIDALDQLMDQLSAEITARLAPAAVEVTLLQTLPGVGQRTAEVIVAEIGTDMTRFPSAGHLASWVGLCPGNQESAGKHQSGRTRKGSPWLRSALVEAAQSAGRMKRQPTYLAAQYRRLAARRGAERAAVAAAHSLVVMIYHMLSRHEPYHDLGGGFFEEREPHERERRLARHLESLGYTVTPPAAVA